MNDSKGKQQTDSTQKRISSNIKARRESARLSQETISKLLGVSRPTVVAWEKSETSIPINKLKEYSNILGMPINVLINGTLCNDDAYNHDFSIIFDNPCSFFPISFPSSININEHLYTATDLHIKLLFTVFPPLDENKRSIEILNEMDSYDILSLESRVLLSALIASNAKDSYKYYKNLDYCEQEYLLAIQDAEKSNDTQLVLCNKANLICYYLLCSYIIEGMIQSEKTPLPESIKKDIDSKYLLSSPYSMDEEIQSTFDNYRKKLHSEELQTHIYRYIGELSKEKDFTELAYFFLVMMYYCNMENTILTYSDNIAHAMNDLFSLAAIGNPYAKDILNVLIRFEQSEGSLFGKKAKSLKSVINQVYSKK